MKLIAQDKCLTVGIKNIKNVIISVVIISVIAEGLQCMEGACWCEKKKKRKTRTRGSLFEDGFFVSLKQQVYPSICMKK